MSDNRRIIITGCGYIGQRLASQLLHQGKNVIGYVSSKNSLDTCKQRNIPCEIINLDRPVAHLDLTAQPVAYLVPPPRTGKIDTRMANFLSAIEKQPPSKFVLISTTGVYGNCNGAWVDESTPVNPGVDRAFRRVDAEQQAQQFCHRLKIPLVILRVPGIYGPGRVPLARIMRGLPIVRKQDSPFTNRIHAYDLVNICEEALLNPTIAGIYNVTDGHPSTMYDYITGVASAMNLPLPPVISLQQAQHQLSEGMLSYLAESRRIDNSKLLKDFTLNLRYPDLQSGLKNMS
ncbi:MAG: SDR family oxidoreductase [Gammaproteobacteria bacterium]